MLFSIPTKFLAAAIFIDNGFCRAQSCTSEEIADFRAVYKAVATIPKIKEVKYLLNIWKQTKQTNTDNTEQNKCRPAPLEESPTHTNPGPVIAGRHGW